jgi:hypothetical protein
VDVHLPPPGRNHFVGTRVCLLIAGLLVIAALYLLVLPLERVASQGPPFDCGTALAPAAGDFARGVCGDLNQRQRLQGGALLLAAAALAGGGRLAFGPAVRRRRSDEDLSPPYPGGAPEWSRPAGRPALSPPGRSSRPEPEDEAPARPAGRDADRS